MRKIEYRSNFRCLQHAILFTLNKICSTEKKTETTITLFLIIKFCFYFQNGLIKMNLHYYAMYQRYPLLQTARRLQCLVGVAPEPKFGTLLSKIRGKFKILKSGVEWMQLTVSLFRKTKEVNIYAIFKFLELTANQYRDQIQRKGAWLDARNSSMRR